MKGNKMNKEIWVLKNGKLLMRNKTDARAFRSIELARNFVMNMIWISKNLGPSNFRFLV